MSNPLKIIYFNSYHYIIMEYQTNARLLHSFFQLLSTSKHRSINWQDPGSVLIMNSHKISLETEQTEEQIVIPAKGRRKEEIKNVMIRHQKIVINDYPNQKKVYSYLTKEDQDPIFEKTLQDLLKKLWGDFTFYDDFLNEDTLQSDK